MYWAVARAGKVKNQTPHVEPLEKKKKPKGRAGKRKQFGKYKNLAQHQPQTNVSACTIREVSGHEVLSLRSQQLKTKEKLEIVESGQIVDVEYETKQVSKWSPQRSRRKQEGEWKKARDEDRMQKEHKMNQLNPTDDDND